MNNGVHEKNTPTFWKDRERRVKCPKCGHFLGNKYGNVIVTKLTDTKVKFYKCYHCGDRFFVPPPKKGVPDPNGSGRLGISWNAYGAKWTADLTDDEFEDTMPI